MYEKLGLYEKKKNLKTTSKKYSCPNFIEPGTQNFYNYYDLSNTQNTNNESLPFYKIDQEKKIISPPNRIPQYSDMDDEIEENFIPIYRDDNLNTTLPPLRQEIDEITTPSHESSDLLPVLDYKFNMREICKQCILLEQHLSQIEKRCPDCCIKHFLALEALSEEAIELDKNNDGSEIMYRLPIIIRDIQKTWYKNPNKNAHKCSQDLRKIRKQLMETSFPIIFEDGKNKTLKCSSSMCSLK